MPRQTVNMHPFLFWSNRKSCSLFSFESGFLCPDLHPFHPLIFLPPLSSLRRRFIFLFLKNQQCDPWTCPDVFHFICNTYFRVCDGVLKCYTYTVFAKHWFRVCSEISWELWAQLWNTTKKKWERKLGQKTTRRAAGWVCNGM